MMELDFSARLKQFESRTYTELRPAQAHVLAEFAADHVPSADVAIELPTGVGKTLIALLIADWALDEGQSVAYLTGTKQLADQVKSESDRLGLPMHQFSSRNYPPADLDDYHQAQAVGLMNYWVYFNSRPRVQPADLLIFDDAHLAEQPITDLFGLRLSGTDTPELYGTICDLLLAHSDGYVSLRSMRDGSAPLSTPPELIAFNDWAAVLPSVKIAIEESEFVHSDACRFVWPELRSRLDRCGVLVGPRVMEIRPYHPPTQLWAGYRDSARRIYMSATLGSMDDLQRRLGVRRIKAIQVPRKLHQDTTGQRLLLLNPSAETALSASNFDFVLRQAERAGRVAWLCASHAEADVVEETLSGLGNHSYRLRPGDDRALDRWRQSRDGHLIAAGRFDGLDLAGDVCRLVVLPSVPAASSEFERFVVAYLGDAAFMRHRVGQRITQALGRANRSDDDWAMYLGLDPNFGSMLAQPAVRGALAPEVAPIIRQALEIHQEGWTATLDAARAFWSRSDLPAVAPGRRPGRTPARMRTAESADDEVAAATAFWVGDFPRAAESAALAADQLLNALETEHSAFWRYVQAHAAFAEGQPDDLGRAKKAIAAAIATGPRTAWFVRLRHTVDDLEGRAPAPTINEDIYRVWDEWLRSGADVLVELARARTQLAGNPPRASRCASYSGSSRRRPCGSSARSLGHRCAMDVGDSDSNREAALGGKDRTVFRTNRSQIHQSSPRTDHGRIG